MLLARKFPALSDWLSGHEAKQGYMKVLALTALLACVYADSHFFKMKNEQHEIVKPNTVDSFTKMAESVTKEGQVEIKVENDVIEFKGEEANIIQEAIGKVSQSISQSDYYLVVVDEKGDEEEMDDIWEEYGDWEDWKDDEDGDDDL